MQKNIFIKNNFLCDYELIFFHVKLFFCRFFVRKTNIGEFGTQKTCKKIIFTKWNFIFHKNYFLQKNIFIKINFVWKNFFRSCICRRFIFCKSYLKNASFLSFSPLVLTSEKMQKLKKSARSQNRHILRKWPILSKKWDFSDLAQSPKMLKTPKMAKNSQKWGFEFQEGMGQSVRLRPGCVDSLICEA